MTETTMKTWAVSIPGGKVNTYELESDARDVVMLIRDTEEPECTLRHFENGQWVVVDVPEPDLRCEAGQAAKPTRRTCTRHSTHYWCRTCNGWYGVPHDGIHPHSFDRQCACRPCRDNFAGFKVGDHIEPPIGSAPSDDHLFGPPASAPESLADALKRSLERHGKAGK